MIKRILSFILAVCMLVSLLPLGVWAAEDTNSEFMQKVRQFTWEDNYIPAGFTPIMDEAGLRAITRNPAGFYILMEDIELEDFRPLCSGDDPFTGVLEGNGHTISGIELNVAGEAGKHYYCGLFSTIKDARIANLKVEGDLCVTVDADTADTGKCFLGGLAGQAYGEIHIVNCVNAVRIDYGPTRAFKEMGTGGFLGYYEGNGENGSIQYCKNLAEINSVSNVGGILGYGILNSSDLEISHCRNEGELLYGRHVGGIVGVLESGEFFTSHPQIYACLNTGRISSSGSGGGIICYSGRIDATINSCGNMGHISTKSGSSGILYFGAGTVADSINTGKVTTVNSSEIAVCAGISGSITGKISRCVNTGYVLCGAGAYADNNFDECAIEDEVLQDLHSTEYAKTLEDVLELIIDCYYLDNGQDMTLFGRTFWNVLPEKVYIGRLSAEEMTVEESFENFDFPGTWIMHEELEHPFPTALMDTVDNTYQEAYIEDTLAFADDSYRYMTIMGGSGDGSLAGVLGDTYRNSLLDEVNGLWDAMQFVEGLANYQFEPVSDYDVLLADLLVTSAGAKTIERHLTSNTLNFISELITVSGVGMEATKVLATEKCLGEMAKVSTIFGIPAKNLVESVRSTVLTDLPYEHFCKLLGNVGGLVSIAEAGAAGCEDVMNTFDFFVLCNTYADTFNGYTDVILDVADRAYQKDKEEADGLYRSAYALGANVYSILAQNPQALFDTAKGSVSKLMSVGGFTILEAALERTKLNPVVSYVSTVMRGYLAGMAVGDALTNMDDIAYNGRMMDMCGVFSEALFAEVQARRDAFLHSRSYEDAQALNLASDLYLSLQILACNYALGYSNAMISSNISQTYGMGRDDAEAAVKVQAYKNKLLMLQAAGKPIYIGEDGSINGFVANCPVTITVTDRDGNEIACLKTGESRVAEGCEGSYQLLGDSGEHKAGMYDPDEHTVTITGEADGTMDLVVYSSRDGEIIRIDTYIDVPIREGESYVITTDGLDGETDILPTKTESGDTESHSHSYTATVTTPTCTEDGYTTYVCACGDSCQGNVVPAVGHSYDDGTCRICGEADPDWDTSCKHPYTVARDRKEATCTEDGYTGDVVCFICDAVITAGRTIEATGHTEVIDPAVDATCTATGLTEGKHCSVCDTVLAEQTVVNMLPHSYQNGSCTLCGKADPSGTVPQGEMIRLAGDNRFLTAILAADQMKAVLGVEKFDTIIVASGTNFADALSGSYLSAVKDAPILLSCSTDFHATLAGKYNDMVAGYIRGNLNDGGTVYILGGTKAVDGALDEALPEYNVKRLAGSNRYETNIRILEEAGVDGKQVLVCNGEGFADSLSASAAELPILLVNSRFGIFDVQKPFLASCGGSFCVIGGTTAVSEDVANQIRNYGNVVRLGGKNRFDTSVMIAEVFFEDPDAMVLSYAWNFPDGLCGGALAAAMDVPLILTMDCYEEQASKFAKEYGITRGFVTGTAELISDEALESITGDAQPGHDYDSETVAPTCTAGGYTMYTCQKCGHSYKDNKTPATGHSYETSVVYPTFDKGGYTKHTCSGCGHTKQTDKTEKLNPTLKEVLDLINKARAEAGVAKLSYYFEGQRVADIRAEEVDQHFSNTRPNGEDCTSLFAELELTRIPAWELLGGNYYSGSQLVNNWLASPDYREALLDTEVTGLLVGRKGTSWVIITIV